MKEAKDRKRRQKFNQFKEFERQIQEEKNEIKELKALLSRAAAALEEDHEVIKDFFSKSNVRDKFLPLVAELRKTAEQC